MTKIQKRFPLFVIVILITSGVYFLIDMYKKNRIDEILQEQTKYLEISYKQGLDRFNVIAENIYISMQNDKKLIDTIANTNKDNLDVNHKKLYEYLEDEYFKLTLSGIMGIQILSTKNISIVRMHKKNKYGDDLTNIRPLIRAVNEQKMHISSFEEGKSSHAFREAYPLYKDGEHIGVMEVLFSSTKLQDYTMRASSIHTHFIVNKNVFHTNEWESNALEPYKKSIEHEDYLFSMNDHIIHDRLEASRKNYILPLREKIDAGIESVEVFKLHHEVNNKLEILIFLPIKRFLDKKTVAYLVSYTESKKLYDFIKLIEYIMIGLFVLAFVSYFVISKLLLEKETILKELQYDGLTKISTRKHFMTSLEEEYENLRKKGENFCICMVDIDYFKSVNDDYGHQYGDDVLVEFASLLEGSLRDLDMIARYGGEEFIILLRTDKTNSQRILESIRQKVEDFGFGKQSIVLTASFGVAQSTQNISLIELIKKADEALYKAKENGRNQVQVS